MVFDFRDDFKDYAEICFKSFGDRVKNWMTINEPLIASKYGYESGTAAPGRCSDRNNCPAGNSSTEPYIASHNFLLAHAAAFRLYEQKFRAKQGGQIGLSLVSQFYEPLSNSSDDEAAAERALDFQLGWSVNFHHLFIYVCVYFQENSHEYLYDELSSAEFHKFDGKIIKTNFIILFSSNLSNKLFCYVVL